MTEADNGSNGQPPMGEEGLEQTTDIIGKIDALLYAIAREKFPDKKKVNDLLERDSVDLINSAKKIREGERLGDDNTETGWIVRFSGPLPLAVTQAFLQGLGALSPDQDLLTLRRDKSRIIRGTSIWHMDNLPTEGLEGTRVSIIGLIGGSWGNFDVLLKLPQTAIQHVIAVREHPHSRFPHAAVPLPDYPF